MRGVNDLAQLTVWGQGLQDRADGLRLTLRQLHYQLVVGNIIPNQERAYKNLGNL